MMHPLAILGLAALGAVALIAVASSGSGYKAEYGTGKAGGNYRVASSRGQACATCRFASERARDYQGTGDGDLYCSQWKTAVRSDYVCDAWTAREERSL